MKKNLLIWDFDGVIADTEKLWLKNRQFMLKDKLGIDWDWKTINFYLGGMSDKTKREVLNKLGIATDDNFWKQSLQMDIDTMNKNGFILTENITDIFSLTNIKQCIATGGIWDKTIKKIKIAGIEKYFPNDRIFTGDMVKRGKPAPDIFLLAAEKMGTKASDAVVVEDSVAGLSAAIDAGCLPIAFVAKDTAYYENQRQNIKNLGVKYIFNNMIDIKKCIETLF